MFRVRWEVWARLCFTELGFPGNKNHSVVSRCDKSSLTLRGTGVCQSNESASVYLAVCVDAVWVVVGGLSVLMGNNVG